MSDIMNQRYLVSYKLNNDTGLYDLTMNDLEFQSEDFVEIKISTKSYFKRSDVITYIFFGSKKYNFFLKS